MKNLILLLIGLIAVNNSYSQNYNNFETESNMAVEIDISNLINSWVITAPSKMIFDGAKSEPNAIFTDSLDFYPVNDSSSFVVKIEAVNYLFFPYFIVEWDQKMDCEIGKDGGIIEVSYNSGTSWVNINLDTFFVPIMTSSTKIDTLHTGELGFSKTDPTWQKISYCWSYSYVNYLSDLEDLWLRFTFKSDSIETEQEGWMIDNFQGFFTIVDAVDQIPSNEIATDEITTYPNPTSSILNIDLNQKNVESKIHCQLVSLKGEIFDLGIFSNRKFEANLGKFENGYYFVILRDDNGQVLYREKIIKVDVEE